MELFHNKRHLFVLLFVALDTGVVVLLTVAFWNYTQDDVFITYAYSRNIAEGKGFVFNPGEHVQGTTTPLYTLLMAGAYLFTSDLLHAGNLLSAFFLLTTCGLAITLSVARGDLSPHGRAAIALTLAASPLVYISFGMETLFYSAVLLVAFWLWAKDRRREAMLAAAALTWIRADGVTLGATLWLLAVWERVSAAMWRGAGVAPAQSGGRPQGSPLHLGLIYLAGIAPWFLFAWIYFGAPLPNTFSAKQDLFGGLSFLSEGASWWHALYGNNPLTLLGAPLIAAGAWRALMRPHLRPLAVWAALYTAGYTVLNATAFWYYTPLLVVLVVMAALGGEWIVHRLIQIDLPRPMAARGALALVLVSSALAIVRAGDYAVPPPRVTTYRLLGEWIAKNTPPDATLLIGDLGIMGYHARRRTIDSPGLIVADMHYKQDGYAIAKYKPDYVVATQYWTWKELTAQDWFHFHYTPLAQFGVAGDDFSPMTVYRRRLPLTVPLQAPQGFDLPLSCSVRLKAGDRLPAEMRARLLSPEGEVLVEAGHPFLWDQYPVAQTPAPEVLIDQIALPLSVPPGRYAWELECDNTTGGDVEVLPVDRSPHYTSVPLTQWSDFAWLRGVAYPEGFRVWSGGSLAVLLHWEALRAARQDYSVFLHLLDAAGQLVAQADGYPRGGLRPTTIWQAGETIVDIRRIELPLDLPEGEYTLVVGWYDWRTGDRLLTTHGADSLRAPFMIRNRRPGVGQRIILEQKGKGRHEHFPMHRN